MNRAIRARQLGQLKVSQEGKKALRNLVRGVGMERGRHGYLLPSRHPISIFLIKIGRKEGLGRLEGKDGCLILFNALLVVDRLRDQCLVFLDGALHHLGVLLDLCFV